MPSELFCSFPINECICRLRVSGFTFDLEMSIRLTRFAASFRVCTVAYVLFGTLGINGLTGYAQEGSIIRFNTQKSL